MPIRAAFLGWKHPGLIEAEPPYSGLVMARPFLGWKHPGLIEAGSTRALPSPDTAFLGWKHPGLIEAGSVGADFPAPPVISGMETSRPH